MHLFSNVKRLNQQELTRFSGRERMTTSPYTSSLENLTDALGLLHPLQGIPVINLDNELKDSKELIGTSSSRRAIEIVMIQLENRLEEKLKERENTVKKAKDTPDDQSINDNLATINNDLARINNNLGCAYAWLDRYTEAEAALKKALALAKDGEVKSTATYNLAIVEITSKGWRTR